MIKKRLAAVHLTRDSFSTDSKPVLGLTLRDQRLPDEPEYVSYMSLDAATAISLNLPFGAEMLHEWLFEITLTARILPPQKEGYFQGKPDTINMGRDDVFLRTLERVQRIIYGNLVTTQHRFDSRAILSVSTHDTDDGRLIPDDRRYPSYQFVIEINAEEYDWVCKKSVTDPLTFRVDVQSLNPHFKRK